MSPYGWYARFPGELLLLACTRDLIDWGVRRRVAALPNVRIHQGADVAGLILGPGGGAGVAGVRLRSPAAVADGDRGGSEFDADLVAVADGRNSRLPEWLTALGYEPPEETVTTIWAGVRKVIRCPCGDRLISALVGYPGLMRHLPHLV
jgi:2-polyprenyl-6-methoxyphenol hydroxylase-like FAD-dependent oxidoreductase